MLRGMGVAVGVPLLDAMVPARRRVWAKTSAGQAASRTRLVCIEQVHGAAGCNEVGRHLSTSGRRKWWAATSTSPAVA